MPCCDRMSARDNSSLQICKSEWRMTVTVGRPGCDALCDGTHLGITVHLDGTRRPCSACDSDTLVCIGCPVQYCSGFKYVWPTAVEVRFRQDSGPSQTITHVCKPAGRVAMMPNTHNSLQPRSPPSLTMSDKAVEVANTLGALLVGSFAAAA